MLDLKITTLIIEKNNEALSNTCGVLEQFNALSIVGKTTRGEQGISMGYSFVPQLSFINIELLNAGNVELIRALHNRNARSNIVILANDSSRAYEMLSIEPFDFLLEPIEPQLVEQLIVRLKQKLRKNEMMRKMDAYAKMQAVDTKRVFPQKKGIIVLALNEILYCKADLIHTKIVLCSGEEVIVKMKIGETFETINHKDFIRTGRSNIINRSYLRKIDKKHHKCLLYYNAQTWEVPVSKNTMGILEKLNVQPIY